MWRLFLLGNFFSKIFYFDSTAEKELKRPIATGPTGYEDAKGKRFIGFYNSLDVDNLSRHNIYFLIIIFCIIAFAIRYYCYLNPLLDKMLLYLPIIFIAFVVIGFLIDAFRKKKDISEDEYNNAVKFLKWSRQDNRRHMPTGMMIIMFTMVLVDAALISVVAMDYVADLPRKWVIWGGISIGFVVAAMLAFLDHAAGTALYSENHRKELEEIIDEESEDGKKSSETKKNILKYSSKSLKDRGFLKNYGFLLLVITLILIIAVAAFNARYSLQMEIIKTQFAVESSVIGAETSVEMLPKFIRDAQKDSKMGQISEEEQLARKATFYALLILTVIFIGIQIVAIMMGYKYSFYSSDAEEKYDITQLYKNMKQSKEYVENKADTFFSDYFSVILNKASVDGKQEKLNKLTERGPMKLSYFLPEKKKEFVSAKKSEEEQKILELQKRKFELENRIKELGDSKRDAVERDRLNAEIKMIELDIEDLENTKDQNIKPIKLEVDKKNEELNKRKYELENKIKELGDSERDNIERDKISAEIRGIELDIKELDKSNEKGDVH